MRTLHPECAFADVKLTGRERFSSMAAETFDSKGGRWQRVHDLRSVAVYLRTQGFTVKQYDKNGNVIAETGDPVPPRPTPVKVVRANIKPELDWRELDLDDAGAQLEAQATLPAEQIAEIEDRWLEEQRSNGEMLDTKVGKMLRVGSADPLMRHVFGDEWQNDMKVFELQAVCRKRGIDFEKSDNRSSLIEKLTADDAERARVERERREREGLSDGLQAT